MDPQIVVLFICLFGFFFLLLCGFFNPVHTHPIKANASTTCKLHNQSWKMQTSLCHQTLTVRFLVAGPALGRKTETKTYFFFLISCLKEELQLEAKALGSHVRVCWECIAQQTVPVPSENTVLLYCCRVSAGVFQAAHFPAEVFHCLSVYQFCLYKYSSFRFPLICCFHI